MFYWLHSMRPKLHRRRLLSEIYFQSLMQEYYPIRRTKVEPKRGAEKPRGWSNAGVLFCMWMCLETWTLMTKKSPVKSARNSYYRQGRKQRWTKNLKIKDDRQCWCWWMKGTVVRKMINWLALLQLTYEGRHCSFICWQTLNVEHR